MLGTLAAMRKRSSTMTSLSTVEDNAPQLAIQPSSESDSARSRSSVESNVFVRKGIGSLMARMAGRRCSTVRSSTGRLEIERSLWSGATKLVCELGETVISVAISDDEKLFVGGGNNKQARVFSTDNGEPVATFEAKAEIGAVAFSGQDEAALLFIGTRGGSLLVFHVASRQQVCAATFFARSSDAKGSDVNALALNKLGDRLVVGGELSPVALVYKVQNLA